MIRPAEPRRRGSDPKTAPHSTNLVSCGGGRRCASGIHVSCPSLPAQSHRLRATTTVARTPIRELSILGGLSQARNGCRRARVLVRLCLPVLEPRRPGARAALWRRATGPDRAIRFLPPLRATRCETDPFRRDRRARRPATRPACGRASAAGLFLWVDEPPPLSRSRGVARRASTGPRPTRSVRAAAAHRDVPRRTAARTCPGPRVGARSKEADNLTIVVEVDVQICAVTWEA